MFGNYNSQTFLSIFLHKIMRILNILLSFDKIGCTSEEKTNEFVMFFPRFALSLQQLQQNLIQQKIIANELYICNHCAGSVV